MSSLVDAPNPTLDDRHLRAGQTILGGDGDRGEFEMFFGALRMSRMPMCLSDPQQADNPIVFCNQAFEQLTGYGQDEVVGRNCRFLQGPATDPANVAAIRRGLDIGQDLQQDVLNYRKDGSVFWNALYISPVLDRAGRVVFNLASQIDVTRAREAETVLQQAQRMETLGQMASSLAHEFNNLMTIVLANIERAAAETDLDRRRVQLDRAGWGAQRAARLTDQVLSFSRRQPHDPEILDINQTLADCDNILDQMAGDAVTVALELCPGELPARVDAGQLELAVLNLVRNAADASPQGAEIRVSTRLCRLDDAAVGSGAGPRAGPDVGTADAVEVAVRDRGTGMPDAVMRRATEPFFTTKPSGRGTGLGLSMVKRFIEQSYGAMEILSGTGQGTTVRLLFPLAIGGAQQPTA